MITKSFCKQLTICFLILLYRYLEVTKAFYITILSRILIEKGNEMWCYIFETVIFFNDYNSQVILIAMKFCC